MKKTFTFYWGLEYLTTFVTLRRRLYEVPILTFHEGVDDFVVYCDALISDMGVFLM